MKINIASTTHKGLVRDHNEDNYIVGLKPFSNIWEGNREGISIDDIGLFIVIADGMGGMEAGEIASEIAVKTAKTEFQKHLKNFPKNSFDKVNLLKDIIKTAHTAIIDDIKENSNRKGMGTTIILGLIINNHVYMAWSGDSRAYRFNKKGINPTRPYDLENLEIATNDHSVVWEYVQSGNMSAEEARTHSHSNIITQSLGNEDRPINPDVSVIKLNKGDKLLFCTDGLNSMVPDQIISEILDENLSIKECCKMLLNEALKEGGYDNITLSLVEILELDAETALNDRIPIETQAILNNENKASKKKIFKYGQFAILFLVMSFIGYFGSAIIKDNQQNNSELSLNELDNSKDLISDSSNIVIDNVDNKEDKIKNTNTINNKKKPIQTTIKDNNKIKSKNKKDNELIQIKAYIKITIELLKNLKGIDKNLKNIYPSLTKDLIKYHKSIGRKMIELKREINSYYDATTGDFRYKLKNLESKIIYSEEKYKVLYSEYADFLYILSNSNKKQKIHVDTTLKNDINKSKIIDTANSIIMKNENGGDSLKFKDNEINDSISKQVMDTINKMENKENTIDK